MSWVTARYAVRSVSRNLRRTVLSIAGIAIGCALALFMESINRGRDELPCLPFISGYCPEGSEVSGMPAAART